MRPLEHTTNRVHRRRTANKARRLVCMIASISSSIILALGVGAVASANPGEVLSNQKISATQGGFTGALDDSDLFGASVVSIGELDADSVDDVAVGALFDDDGGPNRGAVWILFLNSDGSLKAQQKISDLAGGFTGTLGDSASFGAGIAMLGDLDGDAISDIAVGAIGDDDGGPGRGAVWILFLNSDGTVKSHTKISDTQGGFTGSLSDGDRFGVSVSSIGDLDGDGVVDLAVGATGDSEAGNRRGAVWILFLHTNGTVKSHQKINDVQGGFSGFLSNRDRFGTSIAAIGDLDGDLITELSVGAPGDDDGGLASNRGAVWNLFMNSNGTVSSHQKISTLFGGFTGTLDIQDLFGNSVAAPGDLDGDGSCDLIVGAANDDDGGEDRGAAWVLMLSPDGSVSSHTKISELSGGFTGTLANDDEFGTSVAPVGDLDGDQNVDFVVGAFGDDDGGASTGAVWILFVDGAAPTDTGPLRSESRVWLHRNAPNPLAGMTRIRFGLASEAPVGVEVYDVAGRLRHVVTERTYPAGEHSIIFRGSSLGNGVYYYRLRAGQQVVNGQMSITR